MDDFPIRKHNRLPGYDYTQPGCYFVTICSKDREHLVGRVVGADVLIGPHVQLSEIGAILKQTISQMACGKTVWQRGYHDHIVRGEADYLRIWSYIDTNPAKWREDRYYTETEG